MMDHPCAGRPNDCRGFFHKKIIGAIGGAIGGITGGPIGIIGGAIGGAIGRRQPAPGRCNPGQIKTFGGACISSGRGVIPGKFFDQEPENIVSPSPGLGRPAGEAVLGRHGAALQPDEDVRRVRICLRGMVLGDDGLCYNKRDLSNKERWWPRGRRPLLTGGEMRAISIASTAAKKLQSAQKRLTSLGMLKKTAARRAPQQKRLPPGTRIVNIDND